jgi:ribonuclease HI
MVVIYTDGSIKTFKKGKKKRIKQGWGFVAINDKKKIVKKLNGLVLKNNWRSAKGRRIEKSQSVGAELEAVRQALKWAEFRKFKKVMIVTDFQGCAEWVLGTWKIRQSVVQSYVSFVQKMHEKMDIGFYWIKGHSGNKWNDLADKLAKEALIE